MSRHDPLGRISTTVHDELRRTIDVINPLNYRTSYFFDAAGRQIAVRDANGRTATTYDAANQLATSDDSAGRTTYTYDGTGNLAIQAAPGGRTTNTLSAENRLLVVQAPAGVINTMTYNPDGLRLQKADSSGTVNYLWEGQALLSESDGSGDTHAVYSQEPAQFGGVVSAYRKIGDVWVPAYYHFDALGSTDRLTDAEQVVTEVYQYRAYGEPIGFSPLESANPFRWVGHVGYYFDADRADYYIRARHYDLRLARWTCSDPISYRGGMNLYKYANGNPVARTDPSGLDCKLFSKPPIDEAKGPRKTAAIGAEGGVLDGPAPATAIVCVAAQRRTAVYDCCCGFFWKSRFITSINYISQGYVEVALNYEQSLKIDVVKASLPIPIRIDDEIVPIPVNFECTGIVRGLDEAHRICTKQNYSMTPPPATQPCP